MKATWLAQKRAARPGGGGGAPHSALTDSLQGGRAIPGATRLGVGNDGAERLAPPLPPLTAQHATCPPDAWPCLYPELASDADAAIFADIGKASISSSAPVHEWSLARSLGQSTTLVDYEENKFSRRGPEHARSPAASSLSTSFEIRGKGSSPFGASRSSAAPVAASPLSIVDTNYLSEWSIGSLPKGLSPAERARVLRETPASPAVETLNSLPEERVAARTVEGRQLRRRMLKGTVIVFVAAGYSGKRFIYERAKELGIRGVIVDGPDSWSKLLVEEGTIERFYPFDWSDSETVFERMVDTITGIEKEFGQLDGVISFWEVAQPLIARLAEHLGVSGNLPEAVDNAREKQLTRSVMAECGLPTPKNHTIKSSGDVHAAAEAVGFPAVIKPISGAASLGVVRVDTLPQLLKTFDKISKEVNESWAAIVEGQGMAGQKAQTEPPPQIFMMEQYLDGPEVDVDVVMSNGEVVYGSITDNWPTIEPYFNETGSNCPSLLSETQQKELCELAVDTVKALGFQQGVFHVECKYTSNHGPHLIEVNARMGGGPVRNINKLVWGVDLVEEALFAAAGIPSKPLVSAKPLMHIAEYSVNASETGYLANIDYFKKWVDHPDVMYIKPLVQPGEKVVCVEDGLPTWVYEMMVSKPSVEDAVEFIKHIDEAIEIPITKTPITLS